MMRRLTIEEAEGRIKSVRAAPEGVRGHFTRLVELAGLDPSKDLRFGNFSGVDFGGCNLDGYDFTGASLVGCRFSGARLSGATFCQTEFSDPRHDADHKITAAIDWKEAFFRAYEKPPQCPSVFDEHIKEGTYFRDETCSPLMKCVLARQADGSSNKYAMLADENEFIGMYHWLGERTDRIIGMTDFAECINRRLGLGNIFGYRYTVENNYYSTDRDLAWGSKVSFYVEELTGLMIFEPGDEHVGKSMERLSQLFRCMRMPGSESPPGDSFDVMFIGGAMIGRSTQADRL